jgi:outer membrane biosynthesis protein TonB
MSVAGSDSFSLRPSSKPLLFALLVALSIHVVLGSLVIFLGTIAMLHAIANQNNQAHEQRIQTVRALQETPLLFVETDPTQAPKDAPKNAKYYSSHNSVAANPDAQIDTDVPKIEGTQTHVPKAETTQQSKAMPLQPSPPKNPSPAEAKSKGGQKPGDLAMAKIAPNPDESRGENNDAPVIAHQRPRTLAEARQQSAIAGQKVKQDGGVLRKHISASFDAVGTPFGDYDARVIAAIQQRWYDLLSEPAFARDRTGHVVVEFRMNYDGRISDMKVIESDVGDLLSYVCQAAIQDPQPYDRWPSDMRRVMNSDSRVVRFTFFYE